MNNKLVFEIKDSDRQVSITIDRDIDIFQMMEEIGSLLKAWGYHLESVKDGFRYMSDEYYMEEKEEEKGNDKTNRK